MVQKKKLTLDYIEKLNEDYSQQEEVVVKVKVPNGEHETVVTIDKYFTPIKIERCIKELLQKADFIKTIVKKNDDLKEIVQLWLILLIIRNFSSLDIPFEFKKQLAVLEKLNDSNILMQIYRAFEVSEIKKVMDELEKVTINLQNNLKKLNIDEIEQKLKSLDDLETIKNKSKNE